MKRGSSVAVMVETNDEGNREKGIHHAEGWEAELELTERKRMAGRMEIGIEMDGVVLCDKKMHSCQWYIPHSSTRLI